MREDEVELAWRESRTPGRPGRWYLVWYEDGKRCRRSTGESDEGRAQQYLAAFLNAREEARKREIRTVGQIFEAYMQTLDPDSHAGKNVPKLWLGLRPEFEHALPAHVTEQLCEAHTKRRRAQGRSDGTINTALGYLAAALNWAAKKGIIERAPHVYRPPPSRPREHHLTREEVARLIQACEWPHVRLFIILAIATGARADAILSLTWDRVDFERGRILLADPNRPETRKGRAVVPMNKMARAALSEARRGALTPYVIEWNKQRIASIWKAVRNAGRKAGLEVSPHVMRHSAAILLIESGISMEETAQLLGHSNVQTTRKHYARFSPDYLKGAAEALEIETTNLVPMPKRRKA
jgi:integrase